MCDCEECKKEILLLKVKDVVHREMLQFVYTTLLSEKILSISKLKNYIDIRSQWFSEQIDPSLSLASDYLKSLFPDKDFDDAEKILSRDKSQDSQQG
jgi:hypothetical protein